MKQIQFAFREDRELSGELNKMYQDKAAYYRTHDRRGRR